MDNVIKIWERVHGVAILFGGAALWFAWEILNWVERQENLTSDNAMLIIGLLIGGVIGHFTGIAVNRTEVPAPPQVPAALASELIQMASSKATAADIADELEKKL